MQKPLSQKNKTPVRNNSKSKGQSLHNQSQNNLQNQQILSDDQSLQAEHQPAHQAVPVPNNASQQNLNASVAPNQALLLQQQQQLPGGEIDDYHFRFKIGIVGDSGVGKTSFLDAIS